MAAQYDNIRSARWTVRRPRHRKPLPIQFGKEAGFNVQVQARAQAGAVLAMRARLKHPANLPAVMTA